MAQLINLLGGGIVQETTKKELKPIQMQKYTLQQRKRIIFTVITQQVKTGNPIDDWLMKVDKNGFYRLGFQPITNTHRSILH